ncbi:hypothetical protein K438DRAFT_1983341 [Mycena galopus ATCC 62051]|nr:hypothetical protein K438DRAFT_1983341 [Mycena galopus ATCC 62051]
MVLAPSASGTLLLAHRNADSRPSQFSPPASVRSFSASVVAAQNPESLPGERARFRLTLGSLSRPSTGTSASNLRPGTAAAATAANGDGIGIGIRGNDSAAASVVDGKPPTLKPEATARLRHDRPKSTAILDGYGCSSYQKNQNHHPPVDAQDRAQQALDRGKDHREVAYWVTYLTISLGACGVSFFLFSSGPMWMRMRELVVHYGPAGFGGGLRDYPDYYLVLFFDFEERANADDASQASPRARSARTWGERVDAKGTLCPVLLEDLSTTTASLFESGVAREGGTFLREVDVSGFGRRIRNDDKLGREQLMYKLYLVPTLTSPFIPQSSILGAYTYCALGILPLPCVLPDAHSILTARSTTSPAARTTSRTRRGTTEGCGAAGINSTQGTSGGDAAGIAADAPLDLPAYLAACSTVLNATEGKHAEEREFEADADGTVGFLVPISTPPKLAFLPYYSLSLADARSRTEKPKLTTRRPTLKTALSKPWIGEKDRRGKVAYWVTYLTICLGEGVLASLPVSRIRLTALGGSAGSELGAAETFVQHVEHELQQLPSWRRLVSSPSLSPLSPSSSSSSRLPPCSLTSPP